MARGRRPLIRHRRDALLTARFPRSVTAVRADKEVIDFLTNCGNKNLQYLLVPSRLEAALAQLDSDRDGEIDCNEWCVSESGAWGGRDFDAAMASTRLTGRRSAQGGRDRDGAAEQARAARQGARGPGQGRREGDRQVHERVPERTAPGVRSLRARRRVTDGSARRPPGNALL